MKTFYLVQDAGTSQGLFLPKEGNPMKPKVSMNSLPLSELDNYAFEDFDAAEAFVNRNLENTFTDPPSSAQSHEVIHPRFTEPLWRPVRAT